MSAKRVCKCKGCTNLLDIYDRKLFCSKACKQRDYRMRSQHHYDVKKNPYNTRCRCCGVKVQGFTPLVRYCSNACKQRFYREQKSLRSNAPIQMEIPESAYTISNSIT